jgi:hypothetical protein
MALQKCNDCGTQISTSAVACPKCGAPRIVALAARKPNSKRGTFILIAIVVCTVYFGYSALFSGHDVPVAAQDAPVKRIYMKDECLKQVVMVNQAMVDMNVDVAGQSIDAMVIAIETFSLAARLTNEAASMQLDPSESAPVKQMGSAVVKRQLQTFPLMREKAGPIIAKKTWIDDITVTTTGKRFDTMEFVGGTFAANRNIAKAQEAMLPVLTRLRFKHIDYRWTDSAPRSAGYTINSPADGELASVSADGAVTTTLASL